MSGISEFCGTFARLVMQTFFQLISGLKNVEIAPVNLFHVLHSVQQEQLAAFWDPDVFNLDANPMPDTSAVVPELVPSVLFKIAEKFDIIQPPFFFLQ